MSFKVTKWYLDTADRNAVEGWRYARPRDVIELETERVSTLYAFSPNVEAETIDKAKRVMDDMQTTRRVIKVVAQALGCDRWDEDHYVVIERNGDAP